MRTPVTVTFDHGIGDIVRILAMDLKGTVVGMKRDIDGKTYLVTYWCEGCRRTEWLFDWEIAQ